MDFAATLFITDYSIGPVALAQALEERGFQIAVRIAELEEGLNDQPKS